MKALGDAASELLWLVPGATALVSLGRSAAASSWLQLRHDPGAVLLLARASTSQQLSFPTLIDQPEVAELACTLLQKSAAGFVDWSRPGPDGIYRQCLQQAHLARSLAEKVGGCDIDRAWTAGLLAPLGWLATCAVDPGRFAQAIKEQRGFDHAAVVRRLTRLWQLPSWLTAILNHLSLPVDAAEGLGADPTLFVVVQAAVALSQRDGCLTLPMGGKSGDFLASLDLEPAQVEQAVESARLQASRGPLTWQNPNSVPLLVDLLRLAADNRRLERKAQAEDLQAQVDELHGVLQGACERDRERLHARSMSALAEMAAGAGHEINNPLAVISGQAQYVLRQLSEAQSLVPEEPSLAPFVDGLQTTLTHSLKTIVGQSQRIHQVLKDLMQFARPSAPRPQLVAVHALVDDVVKSVEDVSRARKVRLVCLDPPHDWHLHADPTHTRIALTCMLRNALEAAPEDGWAGVRAEKDADSLRFIIEDNGVGPGVAASDHLFDPFYSGRSAGRGRGMGLPMAWRLARQQGGEVSFAGHTQGITRFVLTLPVLQTKPHVNGNGNGNGNGNYVVPADFAALPK